MASFPEANHFWVISTKSWHHFSINFENDLFGHLKYLRDVWQAGVEAELRLSTKIHHLHSSKRFGGQFLLLLLRGRRRGEVDIDNILRGKKKVLRWGAILWIKTNTFLNLPFQLRYSKKYPFEISIPQTWITIFKKRVNMAGCLF